MSVRTDVGTVDELQPSATKAVGLDDFGTDDDNYHEALGVLLESYAREAGFTKLGSKMSRFFVRSALEARLLSEAAWKQYPQHAELIAAYREQGERVTGPGISPAEALRVRTAVMTDWRAFPNLDPDLPAELLPPDWPRDEARRLCVHIYDSLGTPAEQRFREILAEYDPGLAELASHHTFAQASTLRASHVRRRTDFDESTERDRLTMLT